MNEAELRALVRDAVSRHLGGGASASGPAASPFVPAVAPVAAPHASHGIYIALVNNTDACIIEPSVPCEHCGYCKSHGH